LVEQLSGQLDLINWIVGTTPESACPNIADEQLQGVQLAYPTGLRLQCQLGTAQSGPGAGLTHLVQGTTGWCDVLKGKIYNQANRLLWSAAGTPADSQAAVNAWLANMCHLPGAACTSTTLGQQASTAVDATLTALLGQAALEQRQLVTWHSMLVSQ
jgi:hypothetical protein